MTAHRIDRVVFYLTDVDLIAFEAAGELPEDVRETVVAAFGGRDCVAVDLVRQYNQVRYEVMPGPVGHTYYGLEAQNETVNAHRLKIQSALAALLRQPAPA